MGICDFESGLPRTHCTLTLECDFQCFLVLNSMLGKHHKCSNWALGIIFQVFQIYSGSLEFRKWPSKKILTLDCDFRCFLELNSMLGKHHKCSNWALGIIFQVFQSYSGSLEF